MKKIAISKERLAKLEEIAMLNGEENMDSTIEKLIYTFEKHGVMGYSQHEKGLAAEAGITILRMLDRKDHL